MSPGLLDQQAPTGTGKSTATSRKITTTSTKTAQLGQNLATSRLENLISTSNRQEASHEIATTKVSTPLAQTPLVSVKAYRYTPIIMGRKETAPPVMLSPSIVGLISSLILLAALILATAQTSRAQCPWTRESAELHADCICDFNPSQPSSLTSVEQQTLEQQRPVNRMSVQCAPVDFGLLLKALKQTASIELPDELIDDTSTLSNKTEASKLSAGIQLASQAKLDLLHVSNSSIGQLVDGTFILDIRAANTSTATSAFEGRHLIVAIQSLHLSRCGIQSIQANAFAGLEWSLTSLSLADNLLEFVPVEAVNRLFQLKVLDLSNNRFTHLAPNSFINLSKLNALRLADNRIGQHQTLATPSIDMLAFSGLESSLSDLNLKNTQLDAYPAAINALSNLAFLNLAQNQISYVPARSFQNMSSLTAINLERNRISRLEEDTFAGVESSLSSLSLLGNLLDILPASQLSKLVAIRRLDIGFNRIESLPTNAFEGNRQLILVALDGNPLETLPELAFKPLEGTLRGLSIGGKALNCDCRLSWMLRWQQEFNLQISSRERQPQFCSKPHYLRSLVSFAALKPEHLTCQSVANQLLTTFGTINPTLNRNNYTNKWTMGTNSEQATTSYILNQNNAHTSRATTTRLFTIAPTVWSIVMPTTTRSINLVHPSETATTTTTTTTLEPKTTSTVATTQMPTTESTSAPEKTTTETITTTTDSSNKKPETTTAALIGNDLTESSDEMSTSRRDDATSPITTESTLIETDQEPTSSSISTDFAASSSTRPSLATMGSRFTSLSDQTTLEEAKTTASELNAQDNRRFSTNPATGDLPEDELFALDPESSQRKQNRHGFHWPTTPKSQQQVVSDAMNDEELRRNATILIEQAIQSIQASDLQRRSNRTKFHPPRSSPSSNQEGIMQVSGSQTTTTVRRPATSTTSKPKQIHSVFGDRASIASNSNNHLAQWQKRTNLTTQSRGHQHENNRSAIVPAVPTTVNVYKTIHSVLNQTGTNPLLKSSRFVEDMPLSIGAQQIDWSKLTTTSTTTIPTTTTTTTTSTTQAPLPVTRSPDSGRSSTLSERQRRLEADLERYTMAASSIQSRFHSTIVNSGSQTTTRILPSNIELQRVTEIPMISTVSSTSTTTEIPMTQRVQPMLNPSDSPANNTRMSVSSMYRLSNNQKIVTTRVSPISTPTTISTTSSPPTTRSNNRMNTMVYSQPISTLRSYSPATGTIATVQMAGQSQPPTVTTNLPLDTSTRVAQTVRIVDSLPQFKPSSAPTTSTTTTTTSTTTTTTTTTTPSPTELQSEHSTISQPTNSIVDVIIPASNQYQLTGPTVTHNNIPLLTARHFSKPPLPVNHQILEQQSTTPLASTVLPDEPVIDVALATLATQPSTTPITGSPKSSSTRARAGDSTIATNLITKDSMPFNRRQSRDETGTSPASNSNHSHYHRLFGRMVRLDDFDQLALVLAALLCLFILMLAIITACICYTSQSAANLQASSNNQVGSRLSSFSSASDGLQKVHQLTTLPRRQNCLMRFLCCCFSSKSSPRITPMRSLILQDDDNNSSGSSSNGLNRSTGKSMLIASSSLAGQDRDLLFDNIRNASMRLLKSSTSQQQFMGKHNTIDTRTAKRVTKKPGNKKDAYAFDIEQHMNPQNMRPLDHESAMMKHKQAHALDQEYFANVSAINNLTIGRRKQKQRAVGSTFAPTEPSLLSATKRRFSGDEWIRDETNTPDSCDSDKSFSPGANKNNKYNISDAHRAYLGAKANQIQTSRFVTTTNTNQLGASRSGLLATIPNNEACFFDNLSSDKSTTDDSRAPLSSSTRRHDKYRTITAPPGATGSSQNGFQSSGDVAIMRSRSICHRFNNTQQAAPPARQPVDDYFNMELIPMSAEEEWPEPYIEPLDSANIQQNNSMLAGSRNHRQLQQRRLHNSSAYDDAYLANWHSVSRGRPQQQQQHYGSQQPISVPNGHQQSFQQQNAQFPAVSNLVRYRSNPSLENTNYSMGANQFAGGGATSWLRWTPCQSSGDLDQIQHMSNSSSADNHNHQSMNPRPAMTSSSSKSSGWHQVDNQVDSVFIAPTIGHQR